MSFDYLILADPFRETDLPKRAMDGGSGNRGTSHHALPILHTRGNSVIDSPKTCAEEEAEFKIILTGRLSIARWLSTYGVMVERKNGPDMESTIIGSIGGELPVCMAATDIRALEREKEASGYLPIFLEDPWCGEVVFILREWIEEQASQKYAVELEKRLSWKLFLAEDGLAALASVAMKEGGQQLSSFERELARCLIQRHILPTPSTLRYATLRLAQEMTNKQKIGNCERSDPVYDSHGNQALPARGIQIVSALVSNNLIQFVGTSEDPGRKAEFDVWHSTTATSLGSVYSSPYYLRRKRDHRDWLRNQVAPLFADTIPLKTVRHGILRSADQRHQNGREPRTRRNSERYADFVRCMGSGDPEKARPGFIIRDMERLAQVDENLTEEQRYDRSNAFWYDNLEKWNARSDDTSKE